MSTFMERLQRGDILVADGATGTNLQKRGLKPGVPPEELVIDQPELLETLERSFIEAGSDIILTCTFGGTRLRMKESKYHDRITEINEKAVALVRRAAHGRSDVLIGGSIGPCGQLLKPYGPLTTDEVFAAFYEQAKALAEGGVNLFVIETHMALEEARLAVEAAQSTSKLPVVVSFAYDRGVRTIMGVKPAQVIQEFAQKGVAAIGANCGTSLENMEAIIKEYEAANPAIPLWAKPNAGLPVLNPDTGSSEYNVSPTQIGEFALRYIQHGARIVGGCCGSTPEHVAAIAKAVKKNNHSPTH